MASTRKSLGIVQSYVLPALLLFALPLFGLWFSGYASGHFDAEVLEVIEKQIASDPEMSMDYAQVTCSEWENPIGFERIVNISTSERLFKKYLDLEVSGEGRFLGKHSICLSKVKDPDALLAAFQRYLGRHRLARDHRLSSQAA